MQENSESVGDGLYETYIGCIVKRIAVIKFGLNGEGSSGTNSR